MSRSLTHTSFIHVRFSECDPLNIVWHGNYVKYFEDGREAFGKAFHFSYGEIYTQNGVSVPLIHMEMDFKRSISFGETIRVETKLLDNPAAKIVFEYKLFNDKNELLCTGQTIQVFLHMAKKELLITMPPFFEAWKNTYLK